MPYVLEAKTEFERLEQQSSFSKYDYEKEFSRSGIIIESGQRVLDAGCGSGIVSRYFAKMYPKAMVTGCDISDERIERARQEAADLPNLDFQVQDLSHLAFENESFNLIFCRYVLQHLPQKIRHPALIELARCLKPRGQICVIDFDGPFYNIYPQTEFIADVLQKLETEAPFDLRVGRKLPHLLHTAGFKEIHWQIETIEGRGKILDDEKQLIPPKIDHAMPFLSEFLGSIALAQRFKNEYLGLLNQPDLVLFYNKFIVTAKKTTAVTLRLMK
ncbi:MAG: class I SAM-dependent methyltransferase [Deltaproteobacteria bacterium]|nr:class I SAM-dependent methyltransferase [Deltaproteobacteria bacterium]